MIFSTLYLAFPHLTSPSVANTIFFFTTLLPHAPCPLPFAPCSMLFALCPTVCGTFFAYLKELRHTATQSPQRHKHWAIQTMMQIQDIEYYAQHHLPVLITGEVGTGKSYIAQTLHSLSTRENGPFLTVYCRDDSAAKALESEVFGCEKPFCGSRPFHECGKLELAHKGTIVLENFDELSLSLQEKIYLFLKYKSFHRVKGNTSIFSNVRVIGTSRKDPQQLIACQSLYPEFYKRLGQLHIHLPPLEAQKDDIGDVAYALLFPILQQKHKTILGFSSEAENLLKSYTWPGNLRQLHNILERAVILEESKWIQLNNLYFPEMRCMRAKTKSLHTRR